MGPVVVLAVALLVVAIGVSFAAALVLRKTVSRSSAGIAATLGRLRPLADELQQGAQVTAAEVEGLTKSVAALKAVRKGRARRRR